MTLASTLADRTARNHGRDPWKVAARLGIRVKRMDLPAPHRELYAQRHGAGGSAGLAIAKSASDLEARELLAHGIAHHLMHVGDRVSGESSAIWSGRHEREADDFAALLLIPPYGLSRLTAGSAQGQVAELSEEWCVSEPLARRRLRLARSLD